MLFVYSILCFLRDVSFLSRDKALTQLWSFLCFYNNFCTFSIQTVKHWIQTFPSFICSVHFFISFKLFAGFRPLFFFLSFDFIGEMHGAWLDSNLCPTTNSLSRTYVWPATWTSHKAALPLFCSYFKGHEFLFLNTDDQCLLKAKTILQETSLLCHMLKTGLDYKIYVQRLV